MQPPKGFHGFHRYCKNALADLAEILHSFTSILFTPTLKILASGHVESRSYDVIYDVMYGRNRRILQSVAAE